MTRILVVEDSARKASSIEAAVRRYSSVVSIVTERSYQSGLKRALSESFEVVILDMTLPTFDATSQGRYGRPRPLGGYEILRKMTRKGIMSKVIVVTQLEHFGSSSNQYTFDQVCQMCAQEFPDSFLAGIFFRQDDSLWERQLASTLKDGGI